MLLQKWIDAINHFQMSVNTQIIALHYDYT